MISFRRVALENLSSIWEQFVSENDTNQPYQDYKLNRIICDNYYYFTIKELELPVFYLFEEDGLPLCIAPMCKRPLDSISMVSFGKAPTIPIKDFIYGKEMTIDKMTQCVQLLVSRFNRIRFYDVPPYSLLHQALETLACPIKTHVYTSIFMGDGFESYFATLDKHMKQNIRTPYNRIHNDAASIEFSIIRGKDIDSRTLNAIDEVYIHRRRNHSKMDSWLHKLFLKRLHYFSIALKSLDIGLFGVLKINGEVAAFWSGFESRDHSFVSCPRLAINDSFSRYSPGILLLCETAKHLKTDYGIETLDLSRGNHDYKMRMGGNNYYSNDFIITVK